MNTEWIRFVPFVIQGRSLCESKFSRLLHGRFVARRTIRSLWRLRARRPEAYLVMARIAGLVKCGLVRQCCNNPRFRILDRRDRVDQPWFRSASGVTVATSSDTGLLRVLCKEFGCERHRSPGRPNRSVRRNVDQRCGRLCRVVTFDAEYRPARIVLAAIVAFVIKGDLAGLCSLGQNYNLWNFSFRRRRLRQSLGTKPKTVKKKKSS